jgi:dipeptidyl aminopeptidase/acylaminoacyl peptidase
MSNPKPRRYTIDQFINTEAIRGNSIAHDDSQILYSSDRTGIFNAFAVPVSGGKPQQLTSSKTESVFVHSYFPLDKRILFQSDQGGNELMHIHLLEEDGRITDLTPGEKVRTEFYGWSSDGKSFFFGSNQRDPKCTDVYRMDIETMQSQLVFQDDGTNHFGAISPNQCLLAMVKPNISTDSDIWLYSLEKGEGQNITAHTGNIFNSAQTFSVDGKYLYYLTDKDREFNYLNRYNLELKTHEKVIEADWDIMVSSLSKSGRYLVVAINNDARTEVRVYDNQTNTQLKLAGLPDGDITNLQISRSEKLISLYLSGSRNPADLYVYNLETGEHLQLTSTLNPEIDPADLAEAEIVRYPAQDDLEIPSVYYKPVGLAEGEKIPALVWVHGGPGGQSRIGYSALIQYLVNHGYAVIAVNNRGSSGYGKTFFQMADKKHGEIDLADCIDARDYLISTGYVDPDRIGIIGGSYGGYMVLAALAFQPDSFAIGIDIFGVANWVRTLASIPPWWESMRKALYTKIGDPNTEEDYLRSISPLFHAANIRKPLQVLQGENDPRVLKVESDEIVEAVKANNVPVEYVVFPDEGHGFTKKVNQISGYKSIMEFADKYLK